jgi:hypothetical protein
MYKRRRKEEERISEQIQEVREFGAGRNEIVAGDWRDKLRCSLCFLDAKAKRKEGHEPRIRGHQPTPKMLGGKGRGP